jgi:hypothetical protein
MFCLLNPFRGCINYLNRDKVGDMLHKCIEVAMLHVHKLSENDLRSQVIVTIST